MRKASEFRRHADECRALARNAGNEEQRRQLLDMANTWEQIAEERERLIARHPELAIEGDSSNGDSTPSAVKT